MSRLRIAVVVALASAACGAAHLPAPSPPGATAPTLAGTWILIAADDLLPDGTRVHAYGDAPAGLLIVDLDGRYSLQIFRTDRPAFASGDKRTGTAEEYQAAVLGISTHVGHCAIDPGGTTLTFRIEHAAYPNWEGTSQVRRFTLNGDELSYQVPAPKAGGPIPISVWRRDRSR
jgi:hypothetical protein